jgi:hypothetical protein
MRRGVKINAKLTCTTSGWPVIFQLFGRTCRTKHVFFSFVGTFFMEESDATSAAYKSRNRPLHGSYSAAGQRRRP